MLWILLLILFVIQTSALTGAGILYEGWHGPAATAMRTIQQQGGTTLTVERVIQSNGQYTLNDIINKYNVQGEAANFYYQTEPQLGFYCIYRKRPGEAGYIPDCPNINTTLLQHAKWLTDAGVDFVITDATNIATVTPFGDAIQLCPVEVLFEEWLILRNTGVSTPRITAWAVATPEANMWQSFLNLYNTPQYQDLVYKDPKTGKKVFFVVEPSADAGVIAEIESNGGRNDVVVVSMWAIFSPSLYSNGVWAFESPCTQDGGYTTNVAGIGNCNQYETTNSPLGSNMAVSPSYQLSYGSLPFAAPGKLGGLTLKALFRQAIQNQPDYLMISSWNEFISQPQGNPYNGVAIAFSQGLPNDPLSRSYLFVDSYGNEFSRDIEPNQEFGDATYQILASCMRVLRSGARSCSDMSEICCQDDPAISWNSIWSLTNSANNDHLLSANQGEVQQLLSEGWQEICNPFSGPTLFCVNQQSPGQIGPFLMMGSNPTDSVPIYRCLLTSGLHFFSPDPRCEGQKTEGLLGFISKVRRGSTLRGLYRCYNHSLGFHYHSLDLACSAEDTDAGLYGYVH